MTSLTTWEIIKKRWLYYVSFIFIYLIPGALIAYQTLTIKPNENDVSVSIVGLIIGIIYLAFVAKKTRQRIKEMKPGPIQILLSWVPTLIMWATIGCLIKLVENSFTGFDLIVWTICGSMGLGAVLRAIEFIINRKFLYNLLIDEEAHKVVDTERRIAELREAASAHE
jgi:uncharacterized membrane protein YjfL (UPF0719 family)